MLSTTEFRKGLKIEIDGEPYIIVEFQHVKPGKGGAFVRTRIKSLISGNVLDRTYRSGDKVDKPDLEEKQMEYLYSDGSHYHFMDNETYDQIAVEAENLGDSVKFMEENVKVNILFHKGKAISVDLPTFVILTVEQTDPGVKGDTATGGSKPATLNTGAVVQVPLFINQGERLKIDTRTGNYVERAN